MAMWKHWSWAALLATLAWPGIEVHATHGSPRPWRVLILNDADPTLPAFIAIERALRAELTAAHRHRVDVFSESLDMLRFPEALFEAELVSYLHRKYDATPLDAIVVPGPAALDFAERHAQRLWPDARIVFMGVPPEILRQRRLGPNTTGMPRQHDLGGVAELALRLRPSTRRLVVVSGSGDFDRRLAEVAKEQLAPFGSRLAVEFWQDLPLEGFVRLLQKLDADSAVLYLTIARDATGRVFAPVDVVKTLAAASPAPMYGPFETYIGQGIVAGTVYSFESRGRRMGELVHEVLAARPSPSRGLVASDQPTCMADARALERHGLPERLLPAGCDVRFPLPSLWREYRWHVLGAMLVIVAQALLIAALVLQRRRRVRAEGKVRDQRVELAQASRLAMAGELTASIAHEINQPLGAILANAGAAETMLRRGGADPEELRAILSDIRSDDMRASDIIQRVRSLISSRDAEHAPLDANTVVREVMAFLKGEAARRGVVMEAYLSQGLPQLRADRVQLQQAVVNLCVNAMEAMAEAPPGARHLELRTGVKDGEVEISVSDRGPGMSQEQIGRVFDTFFTTKPNGTGLGLSITRTIAEAHSGRVAAENRPEGGARFRIILPPGAATAA
jgi:signal transduction histidine kinase